jgi:hypothetical protein
VPERAPRLSPLTEEARMALSATKSLATLETVAVMLVLLTSLLNGWLAVCLGTAFLVALLVRERRRPGSGRGAR